MMSALGNKSVLVVDDDARMLRALEKVLQSAGLTVYPAFEASDAVEILAQRKKKIDLVITDLRMPFVNGITLLYSIHEMIPTLPVIVLTAFGSPDVRAECFRQGAAAFMEKPLEARRLLDVMTTVLGAKEPGAKAVPSDRLDSEASPQNPGRGETNRNKERNKCL